MLSRSLPAKDTCRGHTNRRLLNDSDDDLSKATISNQQPGPQAWHQHLQSFGDYPVNVGDVEYKSVAADEGLLSPCFYWFAMILVHVNPPRVCAWQTLF